MGCTQYNKPVLGTIVFLLFWAFPSNDTYAQDSD